MTASDQKPPLSIIIPVLDEAADIVRRLQALQKFRAEACQIIVVDGGSSDDTARLSEMLADHIITAPRGRGCQMNAGAALADGDILLFLHADTRLPATTLLLVSQAIAQGASWGRFDVTIDGQAAGLKLVATMMNLRSRLSGIATGDQAIFVTKTAFTAAAGFPDIPLMEDIVFSRRLLAFGRPACLAARVTTAGRRWEKQGVLRTILLMWWLRLRFFFGASPQKLAKEYGYAPRPN